MQRDTDRTFREIHGSEEALLAAIEEIERIALVPSDTDSQLRLRFLTLDPYSWCEDQFALTPIYDVDPDEPYITVSYTWAHQQSTDGLEIPEYKIRDSSDSNASLRSPRCSPIVFHRAMRYARHKGVKYVWMYVHRP
jgi:uncharacterized C2H2 Zn-finger protein